MTVNELIRDLTERLAEETQVIETLAKDFDKQTNRMKRVLQDGFDKSNKNYKERQERYTEIINNLKELERLQSLEAHTDTYETEKHLFYYHEMIDLTTVTIEQNDDENRVEAYRVVTLSKPMSHDEFVTWCNEWNESL